MSDPLAAVLDKRLEEQALAQTIAAETREQDERASAAQSVVRLAKLVEDADLQWFLDTYLRPKVEAERLAALDPKKAGLQGPVHAHRFEIGRELVEALKVEHDRAQAKLDAILANDRS